MRIILLLLLSLLLHFSHSSSLPFNCTNTDGLTADAALESAFTTTYNRDYFVSDMNINIDVTKDGSYEASNVKGKLISFILILLQLEPGFRSNCFSCCLKFPFCVLSIFLPFSG